MLMSSGGHMDRGVGLSRCLLSTDGCIVRMPMGQSDRLKPKSEEDPGTNIPKADERGADLDQECRPKLKAGVQPGP